MDRVFQEEETACAKAPGYERDLCSKNRQEASVAKETEQEERMSKTWWGWRD